MRVDDQGEAVEEVLRAERGEAEGKEVLCPL
jgi:hypothetical protein